MAKVALSSSEISSVAQRFESFRLAGLIFVLLWLPILLVVATVRVPTPVAIAVLASIVIFVAVQTLIIQSMLMRLRSVDRVRVGLACKMPRRGAACFAYCQTEPFDGIEELTDWEYNNFQQGLSLIRLRDRKTDAASTIRFAYENSRHRAGGGSGRI